jgi:Tol biopolymer transport system component
MLRAVLCAAVLASGAAAADRIWSGPNVNLLGAPSRDGRILTFADRGDLAYRDLHSGAVTRLTNRPAGSKEFAYFSVPSPDGARIAYAWFNSDGFYELRMIPASGDASPVTLFRNEDAGFVQPCAWTPDGNHVLTLLFRRDNISQIVLIPTRGGAPKILRSLNWVYPKRMDLSPDGRFVAYDSFVDESSENRAVFVLAVDGSSEERITRAPGSFAFPSWTTDGSAIVYAREPAGGSALWLQRVTGGLPDGEPLAVDQASDRVVPLGAVRPRHLIYGVRTGGSDVFVASLDDPVGSARRVTIRYPGLNRAPAFSPDGSRIAYLSRRGAENFGSAAQAVVVRAMNRDDEQELNTRLAHATMVRWSSNDALLVAGSDSRGRGGIYEFRLTGERKVIAEQPGADPRSFDAVVSGADIITKQGEEIRCGAELLHRGPTFALAASPDGHRVAFADESAVVILDRRTRARQRISLAGVTSLDWRNELVAARGQELWIIAGQGRAPAKVSLPGNALPGFALHPDGKRIALTAGGESAEVWRVNLP